MRAVFLLSTILLLVPCVGAANDWPQFRYDETHQGAVPGALNSELKPFISKWWNNVSVTGPISPPSVKVDAAGNGIVYVGDAQGIVHAIDAESGGQLWQNKTSTGTRIRGAPAVGPETVYVVTDAGGLYGFERRKGDLRPGFPITVGASDGTLMFHEAADALYIGTKDGTLKSYFASTQQQRWTFNTGGDWRQGANGFDGGISANPNAKCDAGSVDGAPVVFTTSTTSYALFGSVNHCFYAVKSNSFGTISAACNANITQNCVVWMFKAQGSIRSSPVVDRVNHRVIFGDDTGQIYAIDVDSIEQAYPYLTYQEPASTGVNAEFFSSPAIWGGNVYVASRDGNVTELDLSNFNVKAVRNLGLQGVISSPAIANGILAIGSLDGRLYMLNTTNLSNADAPRQADDVIEASPAISGTQVFWGSRVGTLYSWGGKKPDRADISITAFDLPTIFAGQATTVTASIKNIGVLRSTATVGTFYFPSNSVEVNIPALNASQSYSISATFTPASTGQITIRLLLDSTRSVKESDESNNEKILKPTVQTLPAPADTTTASAGGPGFEAAFLVAAALGAVLVVRRRHR